MNNSTNNNSNCLRTRAGAIIGAVFLIATGCSGSVGGKLQVLEDMTLAKSKSKTTQIAKGSYQAKISLTASGKRLKIKLDGLKNSIKFVVPNAADFPRYNGNIQLLASESGQPVDIVGIVDTQVDNSDTVDTVESCTFVKVVRICDRNRETGETECFDRTITYSGEQAVSYYTRYETKTLEFDLLEPNTDHLLAKFDGTRYDSERIYTFHGSCR